MAVSQFALSDKIVVDQLKLNSKNKNTTKPNECLGTLKISLMPIYHEMHSHSYDFLCNINVYVHI